MEYAYVRLANDTHGIAKKASDAEKRKSKARDNARKMALDTIGCDEVLYGRGECIYIGFKNMPETDSPWWRKNQVDRADGFYVLRPKVKTEQAKLLQDVREKYKKDLGEEFDVSDIVTSHYTNLVSGICGSNPYGSGFVIASPAFAVTRGDDPVIIGKLPFSKENPVVIPDDFEELTVTQFDSYFA